MSYLKNFNSAFYIFSLMMVNLAQKRRKWKIYDHNRAAGGQYSQLLQTYSERTEFPWHIQNVKVLQNDTLLLGIKF